MVVLPEVEEQDETSAPFVQAPPSAGLAWPTQVVLVLKPPSQASPPASHSALQFCCSQLPTDVAAIVQLPVDDWSHAPDWSAEQLTLPPGQ